MSLFLSEHVQIELSPETFKGYSIWLMMAQDYFGADTQVIDISRKHLKFFLHSIAVGKSNRVTANRTKSALSSMCQFLIDHPEEYLQLNPCTGIKRYRRLAHISCVLILVVKT